MTPLEVLKAARQLISEPSKWTKEADARDDFGAEVAPSNERAVCWCMFGAVVRAAGSEYCAEHAVTALEITAGIHGVGPWNDAHEHAEVIELLDRAIAKLSAEAQP